MSDIFQLCGNLTIVPEALHRFRVGLRMETCETGKIIAMEGREKLSQEKGFLCTTGKELGK